MWSSRLAEYITLAQQLYDALPPEEKNKTWKFKRTKAIAKQDLTIPSNNPDIQTIQLTNGMTLTTDRSKKSKNRMIDSDGNIFYFTGPGADFEMAFSFLAEPGKRLRIYEKKRIFAKVSDDSKHREKDKQRYRKEEMGYSSVKCATFIDKENHETIAKIIELDAENPEIERLIQCINDEVAINNDIGIKTSITWRTINHGSKKIIKATLFSEHLGESLAQLHAKHYSHRYRFSIMLGAIQQVCDVHSGLLSTGNPPNSYIHRDIKLENFLFKKLVSQPSSKKLPTKVTLIDFGFAKKLDSSTSQIADVIMGTRGYLAPEIHQDLGMEECIYSFATDVYALGVVVSLQLVQFALALKIFSSVENKRLETWLRSGDFVEPIKQNGENSSGFSDRQQQYWDDLLFLSEINKRVEQHLQSTSSEEATVWNNLVQFSQKMRSSSPSERPRLPEIKMFGTSLSKEIIRLPLSSEDMDSDDGIDSDTEYGVIVDSEGDAFGVDTSHRSRLDVTRDSKPHFDIGTKTLAEKFKLSILGAVDAYQEYHQPSCCCLFFSRHGSAGIKRTSDLKTAINNISPGGLTIEAIKEILGEFFKQGSCFCPGTAKAANNNHSFIRFFIKNLHENFIDPTQPTITNSIKNAMAALEIKDFAIPETTPAEEESLKPSDEIYSATSKAIGQSCMHEFAAFRTSGAA